MTEFQRLYGHQFHIPSPDYISPRYESFHSPASIARSQRTQRILQGQTFERIPRSAGADFQRIARQSRPGVSVGTDTYPRALRASALNQALESLPINSGSFIGARASASLISNYSSVSGPPSMRSMRSAGGIYDAGRPSMSSMSSIRSPVSSISSLTSSSGTLSRGVSGASKVNPRAPALLTGRAREPIYASSDPGAPTLYTPSSSASYMSGLGSQGTSSILGPAQTITYQQTAVPTGFTAGSGGDRLPSSNINYPINPFFSTMESDVSKNLRGLNIQPTQRIVDNLTEPVKGEILTNGILFGNTDGIAMDGLDRREMWMKKNDIAPLPPDLLARVGQEPIRNEPSEIPTTIGIGVLNNGMQDVVSYPIQQIKNEDPPYTYYDKQVTYGGRGFCP